MRTTMVSMAFAATVAVLTAFLAGAAGSSFPATLSLERTHARKGMSVEHLVQWDKARHVRIGMLGGARSMAGVVQFPVQGYINISTFSPYLTRVKLGTPPKKFTFLIDTGSDMLWVACSPCSGCPTSSGLNISLEFFNPNSSSTSSVITCSDHRCQASLNSRLASCGISDPPSSPCGYNITYGDGGDTVGYYLSDKMHFDTVENVKGNKPRSSFSASIMFGCSNLQSGSLTKTDNAIDGILGIGPNQLSINSQLYSLRLSPKVFSLCLKSSDNGGGILVLGEIVEPGLVYTPLIPSEYFYNLNLQSIAVNGQKLPINTSTSDAQGIGTIVDSGTTFAYLADGAYDPFVSAIAAAVSPSVRPLVINGEQCFVTSSSIDSSFPSVTLHFVGGAAMTVKPMNYLLREDLSGNQLMFCIGWQRNQGQQLTILGDIVLKDKIIVYDLANMRLGWVDYSCSRLPNITTSSEKNHGHASYSISIPGVAVVLTHMLIFGISRG